MAGNKDGKSSKDKRPYKLPIDAWQINDLCSAVATMTIFTFLSSVPVKNLLDGQIKEYYDVLVIILSTLNLLRLSFFLIVYKNMSTLILTLKAMLIDTIPFIILLWLYIIGMSLMYTTLFQDINKGVYGTLTNTVVALFDDVNASYSYSGFKDWELGHMALLIIHVYMGNIVMLNYLIAILSKSYVDMLEAGTFLYKVNLYMYCERYIVAMENPAYAELVKHPAPICLLNLPLALMSLVPRDKGGNIEATLLLVSEYF